MVSTRADRTDMADFAVNLGPSDPQTHFAAAVLYDKTFLASDQQRSLNEYETALALSPHNYLLWLEYGKALGRNGDLDRAEAAFRETQRLAPNYASVAWALGNLLVRKGNESEGFDQIRRSITGDSTYAAPATVFAYQYFDGDVSQIRRLTDISQEATAALASLLARNKRFDDAVAVWQLLTSPIQSGTFKNAGTALVGELIAAKRFQLAAQVENSVDGSNAVVPEQIHDGGFEEGIKLENAGPFEWRFSAGTQPQPLQSTSQPHGGTKSLVLRFGSSDGNSLRQVSQTAVVKPNAKYILRGFYRSDLKSSSPLVWQVVGSQALLVEIPLAIAGDWTEFRGTFTMPSGVDGVEIRLVVKGCGSTICPINGSLWLDDITLIPS